MSEEIEAGAAAPASEAAEVAPEAVSAESAPAEAADTGVAEDSSDLSLSDASDESEAAPVSFPSADEFGWDDWDGTHDALPEPVRGWGSRLSTHYSSAADTKIKEQQESSEYTQRLYDALMSGDEDPRISEYSTKIADWETKFGTLDDKHSTMSTEYEEFKASVNAAIEQEAEEYANSFRETNSDLFSDEKLAETFADLLEEGWDLETAAEASRLPSSVLEVAKKAKADGVPDSYALKLASGTRSATPKPRPGAKLTAGATTPSRSPEQTKLQDTAAMSLKDWRTHVARKALGQNNRRR
tara:strand:- start:687 stop:1583 length:897 start_codon:yes stop_codon:yes gene_type:complete